MCPMRNGGYLSLCYQKKQQMQGTNKWDQQQDFLEFQVTTIKKQNDPCWVQVLQLPNTHPKFHRQELYAPTNHHPLASIQVQLEGYFGLVVQHPTCGQSQHTSVWYASGWHTLYDPRVALLHLLQASVTTGSPEDKAIFITSIKPVRTKWGATTCNQASTATKTTGSYSTRGPLLDFPISPSLA